MSIENACIAPVLLAPADAPAPVPTVAAIDNSEHMQTIEAMRPPRRARPIIAILTLNEVSTAVTVGKGSEAVRSRHGLVLHPTSGPDAAVDRLLPPPSSEAPGLTIERELAQIASRFDRPTADIVALVIEYPWSPAAAPVMR